jgi:hypothetical protein
VFAWKTDWKGISKTQSWWLTPVILVTWEAEIRRIILLGQPEQKSLQDPISVGKNWA